MSQKYQIDLYVLSIAQPIAINGSIEIQIRNQIERVNKASADVIKKLQDSNRRGKVR